MIGKTLVINLQPALVQQIGNTYVPKIRTLKRLRKQSDPVMRQHLPGLNTNFAAGLSDHLWVLNRYYLGNVKGKLNVSRMMI